MPLLDGHMLTQTLIAFAAVALLGLVLRWTFSRGRHAPKPPWPPETGDGADIGTGSDTDKRPAGDPDDFGLLAPVASLDTAQEAARVRALLAEAGIKATSSIGADGRHRVLVFRSELNRARRVSGGSS